MYASEFASNLKKLNKKLRIFAGSDNSKPAGLYYVVNGEYISICGVDKNEIPEYIIFDEAGHILKSGWRRVLTLLIERGLIDRKKTVKLFNPSRALNISVDLKKDKKDSIVKAILEAEERAKSLGHMATDDIMDISKEIRKTNAN